MPNHLEKIPLDTRQVVDVITLYLAHEGNIWTDATEPNVQKCNANDLVERSKPLLSFLTSNVDVVSHQY